MKVFISYSHNDEQMLLKLHTHLSQLKREGKLLSWTDEQILVGENLNDSISHNLNSSQIFIALLSPDYIASNYCYEKEFQTALNMQQEGKLIIIPIILEPCDWLNTPFKDFKGLPKDGKPISDWQNANTAFLDVIQNLRKLLDKETIPNLSTESILTVNLPRNYRVKKDFDSIQKVEFIEETFNEIRTILKSYLKELLQVDDNIKARINIDDESIFESILVNRNLVKSEAILKITHNKSKNYTRSIPSFPANREIEYIISKEHTPQENGFVLTFDEYHLYWATSDYVSFGQKTDEITIKDMADKIWAEWLAFVGIM